MSLNAKFGGPAHSYIQLFKIEENEKMKAVLSILDKKSIRYTISWLSLYSSWYKNITRYYR
jgi:hypothetical protein